MIRKNPRHALKVAQLRLDAAVTITITGKAGSGKSTAADIIAKALAEAGLESTVIEADDSIITKQTNPHLTSSYDKRLYLTIVEDNNEAYKQSETDKEVIDDEGYIAETPPATELLIASLRVFR